MLEIDYEGGKRITETHVCVECGAELTLAWGGAFGIDGYVARCGTDPHHQGFVKRPPLSAPVL